MRLASLLAVGLLLVSAGHAQVLTNPKEAFDLARTSGKPVLLVFSGSDWCAPCLQLERQVLADSAFLRYAQAHVVLLAADFPQRKKIAHPLVAAYEQLADTYNPEGLFPKLVVIGPDKKRVVTLSAARQTPATLVAQLQHALN